MSDTSPRDKYERTVCSCGDCRMGCKYMPGYLIPGDLEQIAAHLGISADLVAASSLLASPGAIVRRRLTGHQFRIPTLVPVSTSLGCVWYSGGQCLVHEVAPYGCSHFDAHMDEEECDRRSLDGLRAVARDFSESGSYAATWLHLHELGHVGESPEVKRDRMRRAMPCRVSG